jgi:hypothetical protein
VCSPGNSEVHSLLSCGQVFSLALLSVPPVRQLLVLFNVFTVQLDKIIGKVRDLSRFLGESIENLSFFNTLAAGIGFRFSPSHNHIMQ